MATTYLVADESGAFLRVKRNDDELQEGATTLVVHLPNQGVHVIRQQTEQGPLRFKFLPDGVLAVEVDDSEFGPLFWYGTWIGAEMRPYRPTMPRRPLPRAR